MALKEKELLLHEYLQRLKQLDKKKLPSLIAIYSNLQQTNISEEGCVLRWYFFAKTEHDRAFAPCHNWACNDRGQCQNNIDIYEYLVDDNNLSLPDVITELDISVTSKF